MKLLILTCTVKPQKQYDLVRSEFDVRLADYAQAINVWIKETEGQQINIWVMENSKSIDLLRHKLLASDRVHLVDAPLDLKSAVEGKSAGEYQILHVASHLIEKENYEQIIKVTGRLYVENWKECLNRSEADFISGRFFVPSHLIDSRFFSMSRAAFLKIFTNEVSFSPRYTPERELGTSSPHLSMEHFLAIKTQELVSAGFTVSAFPVAPIYRGISASTGKQLDKLMVVIKLKLANHLRRFAIRLLAGYTP